MQNQNLANTTRREFLTKGAKMGVALSAGAVLGNSLLFGANGADSTNKSADFGAQKGFSWVNANAQANSQNAHISTAQSQNLSATLATNSSKIPAFTLNNGVIMPAIGFGTLKLGDAKQTQKALEDAL